MTRVLSSHWESKISKHQSKQPSKQHSACTSPMAMATTILSLPHLSLPPHRRHHYLPNLTTAPTRVRLGLRTQALGNDMLGDFGARDPFPAEIASGFGEKVLGSGNTEHKILIPNLSALSLSQLDCSPVSPLEPPMAEDDAKELLRKVNSILRLHPHFVWDAHMVFDEITLSVSVFFFFYHKRKISTSPEGGDPFGFCSKFRTLWVVCFLIQYKLRARGGFRLWVNMAHPLQPIWPRPSCFRFRIGLCL